MNAASVAVVSRCLVELARLEPPDDLEAVAAVVKTWLERDGNPRVPGADERARLWAAARRAAGKR